MADDAVQGELTDDMPHNVRALHGVAHGQQADQKERTQKESPDQKTAQERKADQKRAQMEEKALLVQTRARARQEESGHDEAEAEQGHTTVIQRYELTTMGNADRLEHHFGDQLRYIAPWGAWIWWDGVRWREDSTQRIGYYAEETVRKIQDEVLTAQGYEEILAIAKHYEKSQTSGAISGMIKLAQHKLALDPKDLAASALRLVTASGIVDLRTGKLCPPGILDYDLHWTPVVYEPQARCPRWEKFVSQVMGDDTEMIAFLQRVAGYATTGSSSEQVLLIFAGSGNNGKGVFLRTISRALGEYSLAANPDFLQARRYHGHPTDVDQLRHARLVVVAELAAGDALDEARVKILTGGDFLRARGIGKDFSGFEPTFTMILQTNVLPVVYSQDDGMWRRLLVVPWKQQWVLPGREHVMPDVPVADPTLEEKLMEELPGILRWLVAGAKAWYEQGLAPPEEVKKASLAFRQEQDALAPFTLACLAPALGAQTSVSDVYQAYCAYQAAQGERAITQPEFGRRMKRRYRVRHTEKGNVYADIRLKELKD